MDIDHRDKPRPSKGTNWVKSRHRKMMSRAVTASELAQMGVCERLVVFEHRFGQRRTERQRAAIKRGQMAHDQFYREGALMSEAAASARKGRCYIATFILGPGHETTALRIFRDRILRRNSAGRWLIAVYYRTAPELCVVLERHSWLQPIVRTMLKTIAWLVAYSLRGKGGDHAP